MSTTFSGSVLPVFPAGTTVGAYPPSQFPYPYRDSPNGTAPFGAATASAAVAADGTLSLTGLAEAADYWLGAEVSSVWTYIRARTGEPVEPELAAGSGMTLDTSGGTATLAVDSTVRRVPDKTVAQWYLSSYGQPTVAMTLTEDRLVLVPVWLPAGTIDRMAVDVTTFTAGATIRVGVYGSDGDKPDPTSGLIAEGTSGADTYPLDAGAANGLKQAAISAVIPTPGRYWFGLVAQNAGAGVPVIRCALAGGEYMVPLGTTIPAASATTQTVRHQSGVTGALPASLTISETSLDTANPLIRFRYSA